MSNQNCENCLIPFAKDPGHRESEKYCSLCFENGKLKSIYGKAANLLVRGRC